MFRFLSALLVVRTASAANSTGLGAVPLPEISDYVVILDAGSTGTRAQAFHYPRRVLTPTTRDFIVSKPLSLPKPLFFIDATPGISSFKGDPDGLYHYLKNFTQKVAKRLKHHDRGKKLSEVPIYLGATAGMRNLAEAAQHHLFVPIRNALRDSPFSFGRAAHARVLSGEEEAAYGWLTVNYYHGSVCADPRATFGSLDMGGESTEVAFIPDEPSIMAGLFPMHFGQLPGAIHLYTHSFMHFGLLSAFQYVTKQLLRGISAKRVEHPCLPRGLHWHVQDGVFGVSTDGKAERSHGPLELVGTSDYAQCEEAAGRAIIEAPCTQKPCSFLGVHQPSLRRARFYMRGELGKIFHLLAREGSGEPPLRALRAASRHFCGRPLQEQERDLKQANSPLPSEPALTCFLACYADAFLVKGLGFEVSTTSLMVDSRKHDWPQGAAIYHVNFYPYRVSLDTDNTQEAALVGDADAVDRSGASNHSLGMVVNSSESSDKVVLRGAKHGKGRKHGKSGKHGKGKKHGKGGGAKHGKGGHHGKEADSKHGKGAKHGKGGGAERGKGDKALRVYLVEQKKKLRSEEDEIDDLWQRLDQAVARARKTQRRVKMLKRFLNLPEEAKHSGEEAEARSEGKTRESAATAGRSREEVGRSGKEADAPSDGKPRSEGKPRESAPSEDQSRQDSLHPQGKAGHAESRSNESKAKEEEAATTPSPMNRAFEVDTVALFAAALLSGACLVLMACVSGRGCCKHQGWRRPAREPLLAG